MKIIESSEYYSGLLEGGLTLVNNDLCFDGDLAMRIINSLDGVAITDSEGRYIFVNESWTRMMKGLTIEDVYGKYVREVIPESGLHKALELKKPIIGHGVQVKISSSKDAFTSYYPIFKDGELVAGFVHVIIPSMQSALEFTSRVNYMASQIEYYEKELRTIRGAKYSIHNIIGNSEKIIHLKDQIKKAAVTSSTVLIEGETGCGKELVAHAIHDLSPRTAAPLIKVNCSAIPTELLESEFFGYSEGAFTGAKKGGKQGKFQLANNGTLFLDEISQMPLVLQPKILRAIQEKEIEPVGGKETIPVNTRLIVASNIDLGKLVREKKFREDLFYRLNVIKIVVPPLRERKDDIPLIAYDLLDRLNFQLGMRVEQITDEAIERLMHYDWPGNVRELQNTIERAMNMSMGSKLEWTHFKEYFDNKSLLKISIDRDTKAVLIKDAKCELEKKTIAETLEKCGSNKTSAAAQLGISRTLLYKKIRKYNIEPPYQE